VKIYLRIFSRNQLKINSFLALLLKNIPNTNNYAIKKHFQRKKKKRIITILKSPHINKNAQEQFEFKIFCKQLIFYSSKIMKFIIILKKLLANVFPEIKIKVKFSIAQ